MRKKVTTWFPRVRGGGSGAASRFKPWTAVSWICDAGALRAGYLPPHKGSVAWRDIPLIRHTALERAGRDDRGINAARTTTSRNPAISKVLVRACARSGRKNSKTKPATFGNSSPEKRVGGGCGELSLGACETRDLLSSAAGAKERRTGSVQLSVSHDLRAPLAASTDSANWCFRTTPTSSIRKSQTIAAWKRIGAAQGENHRRPPLALARWSAPD